MKMIFLKIVFFITSYLFFCDSVFAQGFGKPLTIQNIDRNSLHSAASRGIGGTLFTSLNDASLMFSNPASLQTLTGLQISVGSTRQSHNAKQEQQYAPLKYYSNFSLFMEGLTRYISTPVYDTAVKNYTTRDTVQRPFDNIETNWNRSESKTAPIQAFAAMPINLGDIKFSFGVGLTEYANLNWYFQNNNVLSPSILSPHPYVVTRPVNDADSNSKPIQWYQNIQKREGTISSYGAAAAVTLFEKFSFGTSFAVLSGSSDDLETRVERGRIRLYANYFRAESVYYRISKTGTSDYSGTELTLSGAWKGKNLTAGVALKLPTTITRSFSTTIKTDTTGSSLSQIIKGEDKITLPLRGTIGVSILLLENLRLGLEYELRHYASAEYTSNSGAKNNPWLSSNSGHVGLEYKLFDELVLRTGVYQQWEVFEPENNPLPGEAVNYSVYSAGAGFTFSNMTLNVAYQYSSMKFIDMWAGAISINTKKTHSVAANVSYSIPWNF